MVTLAYMAVNSRPHYIVPLMPLVMSLAAEGIIRLGKSSEKENDAVKQK